MASNAKKAEKATAVPDAEDVFHGTLAGGISESERKAEYERVQLSALVSLPPSARKSAEAPQAAATRRAGTSQLHHSLLQVLGEQTTAVLYWEKPVSSGSVLAGCFVALLAMRFYTLTHLITTVAGGHLTFAMLKNKFRSVSDSEHADATATNRVRIDDFFTAAASKVNAAVGWHLRVTMGRDPLEAALLLAAIALLWVLSAFLSDLFLSAICLLLCFTVPKAYETKQALCDKYIAIAHAKITQLLQKITYKDKDKDKEGVPNAGVDANEGKQD